MIWLTLPLLILLIAVSIDDYHSHRERARLERWLRIWRRQVDQGQ